MENEAINLLDLTNWIPALSTTGLLALAAWLFRSLISARLTKSVESEFNRKLEKLKSDLRTKETQIESLRSGAMSGLLNRQGKLYERQLEAIDQTWDAVIELGKAKMVASQMSIIKFEASAEESAKNPQFRQIFEIMGGGLKLADLKLGGATKARPFLSKLAWAYYSAYQSVILLACIKFEALKTGLEDPNRFIDSDNAINLVKAILPHQSDYIDKHGSTALYYLLEEIENLLLQELKNMQVGKDSDKENAEQAAAILKESEKLMESITSDASKA